ncbi:YadA-like family protein [Ignatzschineria cameli]|nr:YadA-like family protein [Ignatzschineria cameli]
MMKNLKLGNKNVFASKGMGNDRANFSLNRSLLSLSLLVALSGYSSPILASSLRQMEELSDDSLLVKTKETIDQALYCEAGGDRALTQLPYIGEPLASFLEVKKGGIFSFSTSRSILKDNFSDIVIDQEKLSISIGNNAQSNHFYALAIGANSRADGNVSIAIGADSQAKGGSSLSIGSQSVAEMYGSTAIGTEAKSTQMFATAIGFQAKALGGASMALGYGASANGNNSIALGNMSIAEKEDEVSFGNTLLKRKLVNVGKGEISEHSTDAINGSQLHQTNETVKNIDQRVINHENKMTNIDQRVTENGDKIIHLGDRVTVNEEDIKHIGDQITGIIESTGKQLTGIETAFGAGANFDAGGTLKQPNYSEALGLEEAGRIKDGVEAGFQYVGKTLGEHDLRIEQNHTDIANITQGTAGLVKLDHNRIVIDNLLAKDAMIFDFSNSHKDRTVTGIAAGSIAQDSSDAVNGAQLFETQQRIENISTVNQQNLEGIADAFGGGAHVENGVLKGVDFTDSLAADRPIKSVNDGFSYVTERLDDHENRLDQHSTKLENHENRLDQHNTKLENHENRLTNIESNISNITEGKAGLIQLSEDRKTLVMDNHLGQDADTFDISNSADGRTLTGVNSGQVKENSKDAINGGQLYASNQSIAEIFGGGATIDKEGYVSTPEYRFGDEAIFNNVGDSLTYLNNKIQEHGIFSLDRDKNQIIIAENQDINRETVVNIGDRKIVGVANGLVEKGSQDAINGSQLWKTNQQVAANSNQIKHINNTLNHYNNRLSHLEQSVQQNRKVASAGISSAIAMSAIPYSSSGKHSFGMGVGSYDGEAAVSMGVIFNLSHDARFKIQGSYDTQNRAGVGVGFAIDF